MLAAGLVGTAAPTLATELKPIGAARTVQVSAAELFGLAEELTRRGDRRQAGRIFELLGRDVNAGPEAELIRCLPGALLPLGP